MSAGLDMDIQVQLLIGKPLTPNVELPSQSKKTLLWRIPLLVSISICTPREGPTLCWGSEYRIFEQLSEVTLSYFGIIWNLIFLSFK